MNVTLEEMADAHGIINWDETKEKFGVEGAKTKAHKGAYQTRALLYSKYAMVSLNPNVNSA